MTLAFDAPVTTSFTSAPLSVRLDDYRQELAGGAVAVDLRDDAARRTEGALLNAVALKLDEALELLTPGAPGALRAATEDARWVLVTDDGYDAEWLAWHLQARGVHGARFLVGGHRALRAAGINGAVVADGLFDVH
ncbi:MAG: rhodanese-like domain-containing protein [Gordonia sp. (in: high G+C Gram-positive bacteria)]